MSSSATTDPSERIEPLFVGEAPAVKTALNLVTRIAPTRATVLITGETGTGKELIARLLHARSDRADLTLSRRQLRGDRGFARRVGIVRSRESAFTGANAQRAGKFAAAHGGTLFFDEATSMSARTQSALLRVLQCGEYCRSARSGWLSAMCA
jgi:DNA-binding NtrC family response regulator